MDSIIPMVVLLTTEIIEPKNAGLLSLHFRF